MSITSPARALTFTQLFGVRRGSQREHPTDHSDGGPETAGVKRSRRPEFPHPDREITIPASRLFVCEVVARADRADDLRDSLGARREAMLLFEPVQLNSKRVIAEDLAYPAREVATPNVRIE